MDEHGELCPPFSWNWISEVVDDPKKLDIEWTLEAIQLFGKWDNVWTLGRLKLTQVVHRIGIKDDNENFGWWVNLMIICPKQLTCN